jgi:putative transposase
VKYAYIAQQRGKYPVALMCRLLKVSRAGFYAAQTRPRTAQEQEDAQLQAQIGAIFEHSRQRYGSPRIHAELRARGIRCGKKRVERLMRAAGLRAHRPRRRRPRTTDSAHAHPIAANHLDRHFAVEEVAGRNRVWVADITYLPTAEGWLYLAVVLDLASRLVVGWSMKATLDRSLAIDALQMALWHRHPQPGLLHHSDRGVQYASHDYQTLLADHDMTCSMSRRGNCWDNAVAESFFATLEVELVDRGPWQTHAQARLAVFEFIEVWYNRQRRHSALGYQTPCEFDDSLRRAMEAA